MGWHSQSLYFIKSYQYIKRKDYLNLHISRNIFLYKLRTTNNQNPAAHRLLHKKEYKMKTKVSLKHEINHASNDGKY